MWKNVPLSNARLYTLLLQVHMIIFYEFTLFQSSEIFFKSSPFSLSHVHCEHT